MPRALFFNVPGHGHINPSLPLVAELSRRGHQITYLATPRFRPAIEAAGAAFRAYATVGDEYFEAAGLHGGVPHKVANQLTITTEAILPELLAIARAARPDYILFDGMCPWGYCVARILRLPAVVSLALPAPVSPPARAMLNWPMLSLLAPMLLRDLGQGVRAVRRMKRLARRHGIAPLGPGALLNAPGDLAISYTSAAFQPYADTVPDTVRFVGWTLNEAPEQDFAPPGKQLIYISLGTMNNKDAAFFQACIDAFAGQEQSVLITTGEAFDPAVFGPLPANIAIHPWLPQTAVLKRAALFVTHGGMNSLHDGLYCGVPLLLVPQQEEQTLNARRVAELGAGIVIKKDRAAAPLIRSAAARLLGTDSFRAAAQRLGATLREAGGAARAADEIEALLARAAQSGASPAAGH